MRAPDVAERRAGNREGHLMTDSEPRMTEAELLAQFATLGQAFLAGLLAAFTIVSAYLVALHAFLGNAETPLKVVAFVFFSATLFVLGIFLGGAIIYADGVAVALNELSASRGSTSLGRLVTNLVNHQLAYVLAGACVIIGVCIYGALFFLTFFYAWPK